MTWAVGCKKLRCFAKLRLSTQSGTSRKKIVFTKKVYEIDQAETTLWISSISFFMSFNKEGEKANLLKRSRFLSDV